MVGTGPGLKQDTHFKPTPALRVWRVSDVPIFQSPLFTPAQCVIIFSVSTPAITTIMAPAQSKLAQPERLGQRKRKVSSRIMDDSFVGAETNVVTKRLKLSANTTHIGSVALKQRQASVEEVDDNEVQVNYPPNNPNNLLEPADDSDDGPGSEPQDTEPGEEGDSNDELEIIPMETAEAQRGELI